MLITKPVPLGFFRAIPLSRSCRSLHLSQLTLLLSTPTRQDHPTDVLPQGQSQMLIPLCFTSPGFTSAVEASHLRVLPLGSHCLPHQTAGPGGWGGTRAASSSWPLPWPRATTSSLLHEYIAMHLLCTTGILFSLIHPSSVFSLGLELGTGC